MPGKCYKTVYTGMERAWHWRAINLILFLEKRQVYFFFSPVHGGSKYSPVPDKRLLFPAVLDKAGHKAVDLSSPLQGATVSLSHPQAVLLLLRCCGNCAVLRRSE